jgi:plastocyanin
VRRVVIALAALAVLGCGDEPVTARAVDVDAADFRFAPETAHVRVGGTVTWRNTGSTGHTIKGPGFFSRSIDPDDEWAHRFDRAGTYDYLCTLHPDSMRGRLVVEE